MSSTDSLLMLFAAFQLFGSVSCIRYRRLNPSSRHSCLSDQPRHTLLFSSLPPCTRTMPPRGRPKRRATEPDSPATVRRRVIATPSPHEEQGENGAASRWYTGRPANWPVAKLLSLSAVSGIKLPLKKAQVLRIYMDNCARGDTVDQLATGVSNDTNNPPRQPRRRHDGESPPN